MGHLKHSNHLPTAALSFFFLLLMFNVLNVTKLPIQDIAFTTMAWSEFVGFFILGFYIQKRKGFAPSISAFSLSMLLFSASYILAYLLGEEFFESSEALSEVLLVLVFFLGMTQINWQTDHLKVLGLLATASLFVFLLQWMHQGFPISLYQSSIRNPNIFGALAATLLYFPLVSTSFFSPNTWKRLLMMMGIIVGLFLVLVSSARAALLIIVVAIGAKLILFISKKMFHALFYIVMLFSLAFAPVYIWLFNSKLIMGINYWVLDHFGKQIFSGRQYIWEASINHGLEKPFFGHFVGMVPGDFMADDHYAHVHNQYIQIFLESGLIGIGSFVFMLYVIWRTYQRNLHSTIVVWSACFYLGILCYQSLEISLFVNMQPIGLFKWLIIAIGLGACIKERRQYRH